MPLISDRDFVEEIIEEREFIDPGRDFYQSVRLFRSNYVDQIAPAAQFKENQEKVRGSRHHFKSYPHCTQLSLPTDNMAIEGVSFDEVMSARKSTREWDSGSGIDLSELSRLLKFSVGTRSDRDRFYPSPGGLYSHEIYLALWGADFAKPGLWHYNAEKHRLELIDEGDPRERLAALYHGGTTGMSNAAGVVFLTCVFDRMLQKYDRRGWRFLHFETGVIIENFYLVATALGLGVCPLGNVLEDEVCPYLGIDGFYEGFMTSLLIGRPRGISEKKRPWWKLWGRSRKGDR